MHTEKSADCRSGMEGFLFHFLVLGVESAAVSSLSSASSAVMYPSSSSPSASSKPSRRARKQAHCCRRHTLGCPCIVLYQKKNRQPHRMPDDLLQFSLVPLPLFAACVPSCFLVVGLRVPIIFSARLRGLAEIHRNIKSISKFKCHSYRTVWS